MRPEFVGFDKLKTVENRSIKSLSTSHPEMTK